MKHNNQKPDEDWFICPHCGAQVSSRASACPQCGSDEMTGWSDDADKWAADIPAGYSHDDESVQKDMIFGMSRPLFAILITILILGIFLLFVLL